MITGAILKLLAFIFHTMFTDFIPTVPVPGFFSSADGAMATVFQYADSMSPWFPVHLLVIVASALTTVWLGGMAVKFGRIVISLLTGGGGSAA